MYRCYQSACMLWTLTMSWLCAICWTIALLHRTWLVSRTRTACRGVQSPKPVMHIAYSPYLDNFYKFPSISARFINVPSIFVQFWVFSVIYVFCFPPILSMMHLRIMLCTYWKPLTDCLTAGKKQHCCNNSPQTTHSLKLSSLVCKKSIQFNTSHSKMSVWYGSYTDGNSFSEIFTL